MNANQGKLAGPHLINLEGATPSLRGSRCTRCGEVYFPASRGCTRCRAAVMEDCDLGSEGTLWSWTIQGFLPKSPYNSGETEADFKPYGVGYVQMRTGIKIESRLGTADPDQLSIGMAMRLTLATYGHAADKTPLLTFVFCPVGTKPENSP